MLRKKIDNRKKEGKMHTKIPHTIKRILIISGMWKYYIRFIDKNTIFKLDKNLPWGGFCICGDKRPRRICVKKYRAAECGGSHMLAAIITAIHIVHELGHCRAYYESRGRDSSERSANELVLQYFINLSKRLKNPPFTLKIINKKKNIWYVRFNVNIKERRKTCLTK